MTEKAQVANQQKAIEQSMPVEDSEFNKTLLVEQFRMTDEAADRLLSEMPKEILDEQKFPSTIRVQDSFDVALDSSTISVKDGILVAPVRIAKAMVQDYSGMKVLKCAKELRKAADFAKQLPITDNHPPEKLVTSQKQIKGWTSVPKFSEKDSAIDCVVETTDKKIITDVVEKKKMDVSIGFQCDLVMQKGKFEGQDYDAVQTDIVLNHVAVGIERGRCATPSCGFGITSRVDCADEEVHPDTCECDACKKKKVKKAIMDKFKKLTPEEIAKLTPEEKMKYEEELKIFEEGTADQEVEMPMPEKKEAIPAAPPQSPTQTTAQSKIPELLQNLNKTLGEILTKKMEMSAEQIAAGITKLKGMLDEIRAIVEAEKGTEASKKPTEEAGNATAVANSAIKDCENYLKDITKKIDSIMDFKPDKPRADFEKIPMSGLDSAIEAMHTAKKLKAPTSDSLTASDAIDQAYEKAMEKRFGKK